MSRPPVARRRSERERGTGAALPPGLDACEVEVDGEHYLVLGLDLPNDALAAPAPAVERLARLDLSDGVSLTAAEREVAALILAGLDNRMIGRRRGTTERTTANQVGAVFRKLGVGSRAQLAARLATAPEADEPQSPE